MYLFGGWDGTQELADLWAYSIPSGRWTCLSMNTKEEGGPSARSAGSAVFDDATGYIYFLGRYVVKMSSAEKRRMLAGAMNGAGAGTSANVGGTGSAGEEGGGASEMGSSATPDFLASASATGSSGGVSRARAFASGWVAVGTGGGAEDRGSHDSHRYARLHTTRLDRFNICGVLILCNLTMPTSALVIGHILPSAAAIPP